LLLQVYIHTGLYLIASSSATIVKSFAKVAALWRLSENNKTFLPALGESSNSFGSVIAGGCILNCSEIIWKNGSFPFVEKSDTYNFCFVHLGHVAKAYILSAFNLLLYATCK